MPTVQTTIDAWLAASGAPPEEFARRTMPLSFAPGWTDAHADEFEALLAARLEYPTPPACWRAQFDAATRFVQDGPPVEDIAVPTLVLHGDVDRVIPVENGRALARRIPDARLNEMGGHGHLIQIEAREAFNNAVVEFLGAPR